MLKLSKHNELNPFDNYSTLQHIDNIRINKLLSKINNRTCLLADSNNTYIIHPSSKQVNKIQCSIFYNNIPMSDMTRDNYKQIIKDIPFNSIKIIKILEVTQ